MSKRPKPAIAPPTPVLYCVNDTIRFRLAPTRNTPVQTFTGTITCTPDRSPLGCYHVETAQGEAWFILESEIMEKVEVAA